MLGVAIKKKAFRLSSEQEVFFRQLKLPEIGDLVSNWNAISDFRYRPQGGGGGRSDKY